MPYVRRYSRRRGSSRYSRVGRKFNPQNRGPLTNWFASTGSWAPSLTDDGHIFSYPMVVASATQSSVLGGIKWTMREEPNSVVTGGKRNNYVGGLVKTRATLAAEDTSASNWDLRQIFAKESWIEHSAPTPLLIQRTVRGTVPVRQGESLYLVLYAPAVDYSAIVGYMVEYSIRTTDATAV